jgi:hypothetical protein
VGQLPLQLRLLLAFYPFAVIPTEARPSPPRTAYPAAFRGTGCQPVCTPLKWGVPSDARARTEGIRSFISDANHTPTRPAENFWSAGCPIRRRPREGRGLCSCLCFCRSIRSGGLQTASLSRAPPPHDPLLLAAQPYRPNRTWPSSRGAPFATKDLLLAQPATSAPPAHFKFVPHHATTNHHRELHTAEPFVGQAVSLSAPHLSGVCLLTRAHEPKGFAASSPTKTTPQLAPPRTFGSAAALPPLFRSSPPHPNNSALSAHAIPKLPPELARAIFTTSSPAVFSKLLVR